jgi:hypothetical protein
MPTRELRGYHKNLHEIENKPFEPVVYHNQYFGDY